jgi:hypothetical protein
MQAARTTALTRQPFGYALIGEFGFLAMMLSCCAIQPSWFAVKRGLSFYGNSATTVVPYALGFGLSIALTALALARVEPRSPAARRFRTGVAVLLALTAAVPLTPYAADAIFDWLHIGVVAVLFSFGLVLGGWITWRARDRITLAFYLVETAAGISIVAAQVGMNEYMIPSELVFQSAAFALVAWGIRRLGQDESDGRSARRKRTTAPGASCPASGRSSVTTTASTG